MLALRVERDRVHRLADRTAADLQAGAFRLGATLHSESPKTFGGHLSGYWQAWQELGDAAGRCNRRSRVSWPAPSCPRRALVRRVRCSPLEVLPVVLFALAVLIVVPELYFRLH